MVDNQKARGRVFVTGANGYIGLAVCRAFVRAGYHVYGLVRRPESSSLLETQEIIPVVGSISEDVSWLDKLLDDSRSKPFDVIASCTEAMPFDTHYQHLLAIFTAISKHARKAGSKPLVLMSSGCKDYGTTGLHGSPDLEPHTEESPLNPPDLVKGRAYSVLDVFEHSALFDAAVLRPTSVYGYGSSYYGTIFDWVAQHRNKEVPVEVPGDFNTIFHGCHVDDCAEAYVALAEHPARSEVAGQCFNVSAGRYETLADFTRVLGPEYGIPGVTRASSPGQQFPVVLAFVLEYSQWVDSSKIRKLTGWSDKRMLLTENIHAYRIAYDAAAQGGDAGVVKKREMVAPLGSPENKAG
ncbi:NAD(P)-binding protein [Xylariaceae sp. FL0804]|nr:NAD(P)-binding protein [Xylariaceae sp. FL0804]KAI0470075.1 NAD(P)-binding protein [Xylariaceae sp. FL0804]